jgi:hypothetical protein
MAKISRKKDTYIIRSPLSKTQLEQTDGFGAWCYLHRVDLQHAAGTGGSSLSFDVRLSDESVAFLFRAICEIEADVEAKMVNNMKSSFFSPSRKATTVVFDVRHIDMVSGEEILNTFGKLEEAQDFVRNHRDEYKNTPKIFSRMVQ